MNALSALLRVLLPAVAIVATAAEKTGPDKPGPASAGNAAASGRTEKQKTAQQLHDQGLAAFKAGNLTAAEFAFEKVLGISPDNPAALINLALVEQRRHHHDKAEQYLRRLLRENPENATAWLILGIGAYQQDHQSCHTSLAALRRGRHRARCSVSA